MIWRGEAMNTYIPIFYVGYVIIGGRKCEADARAVAWLARISNYNLKVPQKGSLEYYSKQIISLTLIFERSRKIQLQIFNTTKIRLMYCIIKNKTKVKSITTSISAKAD